MGTYLASMFQVDLTDISKLAAKSLLSQNAKRHLIKYLIPSNFPTCFVQIRKIPERKEKFPAPPSLGIASAVHKHKVRTPLRMKRGKETDDTTCRKHKQR
jgi:hypothetical protein